MKLNTPFWALIDPSGTEIVWDWEAPYQGKRQEIVTARQRAIEHAERTDRREYQERPLVFWKACTVQKIVVQIVVKPVRSAA